MSNSDPTRPLSTGRGPQVEASAPGRVNLMGDHTDYNDGFVLPVAIPQTTRLVLSARTDDTVNIGSTQQPVRGSYQLGHEQKENGWLDYVQGVTATLRLAGHTLGGFDAHVTSQVPMGAGLSSSAAFTTALLRALRLAFGLKLTDLELARLAQAAEVEFVGVPVGIMDPLAASLGRTGCALFVDTRSLSTREISMPEQLELVVIDSGVVHNHAAGAYRQRRSECEQAAAALGVRSMRDLGIEDVVASQIEPTLKRRALHVVSENLRVLDTVHALEQLDRDRLKHLFSESHASLRDDYEVSAKGLDLLVSIASQQPEVVAARMTGGGFGGSVVLLVERAGALAVSQRVALLYDERSLFTARVLLPVS